MLTHPIAWRKALTLLTLLTVALATIGILAIQPPEPASAAVKHTFEIENYTGRLLEFESVKYPGNKDGTKPPQRVEMGGSANFGVWFYAANPTKADVVYRFIDEGGAVRKLTLKANRTPAVENSSCFTDSPNFTCTVLGWDRDHNTRFVFDRREPATRFVYSYQDYRFWRTLVQLCVWKSYATCTQLGASVWSWEVHLGMTTYLLDQARYDALANGQAGEPYTTKLISSVPGDRVVAWGLPPGLRFDSRSGSIIGTPNGAIRAHVWLGFYMDGKL